jgi:hypothetical protein
MDAVLTLFVDVVLALCGRVFLRAVSFGRWQTEAWSGSESATLAPAGALSYLRAGRRVFTHTGQQLAGLVFLIVLVLLGVLYANAI